MRSTTRDRYCVCAECQQLPIAQIITVMLNFIIPVVYFVLSYYTYDELYFIVLAWICMVFVFVEYTLIIRFCIKNTMVTSRRVELIPMKDKD
jgi:hypothetical protein